MRQKKRKTTEKETLHQRHDSLHCPKDTGKTKQITNWSVSTFKGKFKFHRYRYKIVKYKPRAFNRKIEIKPILILLNISLTANNHF